MMSCCSSPTSVVWTLKTKLVSEGKIHKEGRVYGEEMDLGGSHMCDRGVLLHGTSSCCSSMFSFACPRLVSARAIFSHVHPSLLLSCPQALRRDLSSQQAAWKGANISVFCVCPFCIFVATSQRQENCLPLYGSSFLCLSCLSSQLALEEQKAMDKWMSWFPGTDTACPGQSSRLCWSLLKSVKR